VKGDFIRDNPQIIQALREAQNKKTDALLAVAENCDHTFSPRFEQQMDRLIRAQRKPYYPLIRTNGRKAVLALAAAFILMMSLVFGVSALRKSFVEILTETYEKFSTIFFVQSEPEALLPTSIERTYMPEYILEGYALDAESTVSMSLQRIWFFAGENGTIEFQQFVLGSGAFTANTEGIQTEEVLVGEDVGLYYSNRDKQSLVWENDQYGFMLTGPIDKDTLLAMARSLKEK
jgi:hypothetical protein